MHALSAGSKGYSFATWLRLDSVDDGKDAKSGGGRALYTLLWRSPSEAGARGVAAAFKGGPRGPAGACSCLYLDPVWGKLVAVREPWGGCARKQAEQGGVPVSHVDHMLLFQGLRSYLRQLLPKQIRCTGGPGVPCHHVSIVSLHKELCMLDWPFDGSEGVTGALV